MLELRTEENEAFQRFFELVRRAAAEQDALFFVYCGEGRELFTDTLEGENLSGWLIPKALTAQFLPAFQQGTVSEAWDDFLRLAIWRQSSTGIQITFHSFP
jgi:hypothetical protein